MATPAHTHLDDKISGWGPAAWSEEAMAQASIKLSDSAAINGCVPLWKDRSNDVSAGPSTCRPSPPVSWNSLSSATIASNYRKCEK